MFTIVNIAIKIELNRMNFYRFLFLLFAFIGFNQLQAQEVWSLEKCIAYAFENNISLLQRELSIEGLKIAEKQAKANRLPSLNGSVRYNVNFSNAVDPTTFERLETSQAIQSNSFDLTTQVLLYQGGRLRKLIERSQLDLQKILIDKEAAKNDISLAIASTYLNVLLAKEQLGITENQKGLSIERKNNTQKLIDAGLLPEGDIFDLESQIANDDLNITSAQNVYDIALLELKLLLDVDPDMDMILESPPDIEPSASLVLNYNIEEILASALTNQPIVKSAILDNEISLKNLELEKTGRYPTLSFIGNLSTNFSTARRVEIPSDMTINVPFELSGFKQYGLEQDSVVLFTSVDIPAFDKIGYFKQLNDNFFPFLALNLQIPIFNQMQVNNRIEQAKLGIENSKLNQRTIEQNLNRTIRQAYLDAIAASKTYQATQKSIAALNTSAEYTEKRYNLGVATSLELRAALDALVQNEIIAKRNKYDYLFKLKILDFYLGKPIKF